MLIWSLQHPFDLFSWGLLWIKLIMLCLIIYGWQHFKMNMFWYKKDLCSAEKIVIKTKFWKNKNFGIKDRKKPAMICGLEPPYPILNLVRVITALSQSKYFNGFGVFLVHLPMASVLLSASVERCFVSRMRDLFLSFLDKVVKLIGGGSVINGVYPV